MSITTELREWAREQRTGNVLTCYPPKHEIHGVEEDLLAIADRIDAKTADMQAFCDRLQEAAESREDVTLWGTDYTALPVDADGVPIRVGDEMEPISVKYDRFGVVTLCLDTCDGRWSLLTDLDGEWSYDELCQLRHYHAPKVEDVLLEACKAYHGLMVESMSDVAHDMQAPSEVIAEYAAKLRLKEDA